LRGCACAALFVKLSLGLNVKSINKASFAYLNAKMLTHYVYSYLSKDQKFSRELRMTLFPGKYCYIGLAVLAVVEIVWLQVAGHSIRLRSVIPVTVNVILFSLIMLLLYWMHSVALKKRSTMSEDAQNFVFDYFMPMMKTLMGGILYMLLGWIVLRLFNHLTMTSQIPYADDFLVYLDSFIPIDWNAYFQFVAERPFLVFILDEAYTGLDSLSVVAFIALVVIAKYEHARYFAVAFTITAIVCTVIGMFFPALAAVEYTLENKDLLKNFPYSPGTYSVEILERLRNGLPQEFDLNKLPGLTTFPSFHTGAGIVMLYAFRRTFLFWPVVLYTIVMVASTPVYGGHYFVDIIFGTLVAAIVCKVVEVKWFADVYKPQKSKPDADIEVIQPAE